ncbi:MAG: GNAT family N-acetyltransferase [Chloroflexi bacterium]|nr:GNAT family N-acetyltransferase [Chloroflexota bacterium]MCY3936879.1 GNAT family N-acetyltransferase [Chloroflexota bacterium]
MDQIEGPRAAAPEETGELHRLITDVFGTSDMPGGQVPDEYPLIFRDKDPESRRVICVDGKIVSYVGLHIRNAVFFGCEVKVASVGGVCTHPAYRGRGLATILMNHCESFMQDAGVDLVIVSGERGLYRRLEYELAGSVSVYRIPADTEPDNGGYTIRDATEADIGEMVRLYQRLPVRFHRPLEDFQVAVRAIWIDRVIDQRHALVAERDGSLQAYLTYTVHDSDNESGAPDPTATVGEPSFPLEEESIGSVSVGNRIANEFAGGAGAVLALARAAAGRAGAPHFDLSVAGAYRQLLSECAGHGYPRHVTHQPGTFKLLAPSRFLDAIKPLIIERAGADIADRLAISITDGTYLLELDNQHYRIGRNAGLLELIFEPGLRAEIGPNGRLGEAVSACFPLPMIWTGLNFV